MNAFGGRGIWPLPSGSAAFAPFLRLRGGATEPKSESVERMSKSAASGKSVGWERIASSSDGGGAVKVTGVTFGANEIVWCEAGSTGDVHVNWNAEEWRC